MRAYIAKEQLRRPLSSVNIGGDPHLVSHRLHKFLAWCINSDTPELLALARTIDAWRPEYQRVPGHRHHQRPHLGLQQTGQDRKTLGMRVPQPRELDAMNTLSLHPHPTGRHTSDFMLIARRTVMTALDKQSVIVPGTQAAELVLSQLADQLTSLLTQREQITAQAKEILDANPRAAILTSMPCIEVKHRSADPT